MLSSAIRRLRIQVRAALWRRASRIMLAIATTAGLVGALLVATRTTVLPAHSYSDFLHQLQRRTVDSVTITAGTGLTVYDHRSADAVYTVTYGSSLVEVLAARVDSAGAKVTFAAQGSTTTKDWASGLLTILIVGGIGLVAVQVVTSANTGGGAELGTASTSTLTFANVAGNSHAVAELKEMVDFVKHPERFTALGARPPRGALLLGPPGTGKTLMAKALAGEAGVPCYTISGSEVSGFIVGLGVMRVKKLFRKARKSPSGAIIFIDEVDALGGIRGRDSSHSEDDRTLNQLLVEMDGFSPTTNVFVLASTNRADTLDPALMRPGRFDRQINVGLPSADERGEIVRMHIAQRNIPIAADVDLDRLARLMPGASGAVLANLVNEAAIVAARDAATSVRWAHIEQARDRLLLGAERPMLANDTQETDVVAMHEAGHALAGVMACPEDALHKVTIRPRGQALGVAFFSPDSDRSLYTRQYLEGQLVKTLAGRAAEALLFTRDVVTSGAASDLEHANRIARDMVARLGLGPTTGLLIHGREAGTQVSPATLALMDQEVKTLLDAAYARATDLLTTHRVALVALGEALKVRQTLTGAEALEIFRANHVAC
ncbi:MAG: AAA family ATPase [bacterium]